VRWSCGTALAQRGQTLIEFALVAPLVLFFLLAIVDFGIAIDRRLVLDHAVREGARYAAVGGNAMFTGTSATEDDIKDHTAAHSQGIADPAGTIGSGNYIDVCYWDENGSGRLGDKGDRVEVRVRYQHDFVTGFTGLISLDQPGISMNPRASSRVEWTVEPEPVDACTDWPPP
jgi:hypothetical protein